MSRCKRPTAFDVSFPDEVPVAPRPGGLLAGQNAPKRKSPSGVSIVSEEKRRKMVQNERRAALPPPKLCYAPHPRDVKETQDLVIWGEDDADEDEDTSKPIRVLLDFCVFDPKHNMQTVSLSLLDEEDNPGSDLHFEAAGFVAPVFVNEEDAGQEDDLDDEESASTMQRLRTSAIFRYTIDYTRLDDPVYVETQYGWYILREPSPIYRQLFLEFYQPHRLLQIILSAAAENRTWSFKDFSESYVGTYDRLLTRRLEPSDINSIIPRLRLVLEDHDNGNNLAAIPMIHHLLSGQSFASTSKIPRIRVHPSRPGPITRHQLTGNVDLAVLRSENQNRTHVTPLIDRLAMGLFREHLEVVGPPPKPIDKQLAKQRESQARLQLFQLLDKTTRENRNPPVFSLNWRLHDEFWHAVLIDGEEYKVGDVIVTVAGAYGRREEAELPDDLDTLPDTATIADYFWFAQILYINQKSKQLHVRWFEHSSKALLQEISDPQELFAFKCCSFINTDLVKGKVTVHWSVSRNTILPPTEFYCNLLYDDNDGSFTAVDHPSSERAAGLSPPQNCPVCLLSAQQEEDQDWRKIKDGIVHRGVTYHIEDYVLVKTEDGPADIGQILDVRVVRKGRQLESAIISLRMLGRISDIIEICSPDVVKDERHLFLTDEKIDVPVELLLRRCSVLHIRSIRDLSRWLSFSPIYFYVRYHFASLKPLSWADKTPLRFDEVRICEVCYKEERKEIRIQKKFLAAMKQKPLRGFDPFCGVGAFGLGMEESGCLKMVHAVEISPSAAKTLKHNSPDTVVHNQCSNVVFKYAVKLHEGHDVEAPQSLGDGHPLPRPPQPGEIDCIVAGFPCQPHSRLNQFQKANDRKSHLILNLLAWVDFLRPKYCFFENVRGFLGYNLNATQASRYRVEGGISMGGLKFIIRALLAMDYQLRFGLLQAAHYGTPQSRVRFFLVAAHRSCPLPNLPQPTHDFPLRERLQIQLPNEVAIRPLQTTAGIAPHRFVSIDDAIADLPRFDWENPRKLEARVHGRNRNEPRLARRTLPCDRHKAFCGLAGSNVAYHCEPRTSYQVKCRARPTQDLQHYTRVLKEETVERVVNIPLNPKADYRSLEAHLWEWQFSNPSSAVARDGFRPGLYGRLDAKAWFQTTVTNVEPTAKQSWVLNPYCARMVTVRELARSQGFPDDFVFLSLNNDVKTMQRQIGNAVAFPLAAALGRELRDAVLKKWRSDQEEAIVVE